MASDTPGDPAEPSNVKPAVDAAESTVLHGEPVAVPPPVSATLQAAFRKSRYQPRRLHAHGGLGEVYEADDLELGRAVALKRMRDGRGQRESDRERFRREAEITGRLEHPGVIPIYGLGCDAGGQPFYAMRFIRGETLADAIDAFHRNAEKAKYDSLPFRRLLQRLIAACNAVGFAHSHGIIHRDLKPANIMLGDFGETHVVDWGLAKQVGESTPVPPSAGRNLAARLITDNSDGTIATEQSTMPAGPGGPPPTGSDNSAPTEIGTVLGTPAFMSPEQAAGQWDEVSSASDIFSLGATLYVMLTGRSAYRGELAVADAVDWQFMRPRSVKPAIPPELEAICLKAMARKPDQRYHRSLELASDIEKWMGHEPVAVYREPWTKRMGRWVQRHRTLVSTIGAALAVAVLILGVGSILLNAARRGESSAKEQAERLAADAARQRDEAQAKYQLARRAVDEMLTAASEKLRTVQDVTAVRRELLQQALGFYEQFLQERSDDPQVRRETANAYWRAAAIHKLLGEHSKAENEYRQSMAIWSALVADEPDDPLIRSDLAGTHNDLGWLLSGVGRTPEAEKEYLEARNLHAKLREQFPTVAMHSDNFARSAQNLAGLYESTGRVTEAEAAYRETLAIRRALAAENPKSAKYQAGLARILDSLGDLLSGTPKVAEAEKAYRESADILRNLVYDHPSDSDYRDALATSLHDLGALFANTSRFAEAEPVFASVIELRRKLVVDFPGVPDIRQRYGLILQAAAWLQRTTGKLLESEKSLLEALQVWERLTADFPAVPSYFANMARTCNELGWTLSDMAREPESIPYHERALAEFLKLAKQSPDTTIYQFELTDTYNYLGMRHTSAQRWADAESNFRKALDIRERLARDFPNDLTYADALGGICCNLGDMEVSRGKPAAALPWYAKGQAALTQTFAKDERRTTTRRFLSGVHWGRARALAALGRHDEAKPDWERAIALASEKNRLAIRLAWMSAKFGSDPAEKPKDKHQ